MKNPTKPGHTSTHMTHVSLMRAAAMVTVVMYHSLCFYAVWSHPAMPAQFAAGCRQLYVWLAHLLVKVNMPLFVFLSGFLYAHLRIECGRYANTRKFVWGKVKRLLVPYLFWSLALIVCFPIRHHNFSQMLFGFCHLWFLLMLFEEAAVFHFTSRWWMRWPHWVCWLSLGMLFALHVWFRTHFADNHSEWVKLLRQFIIFMPYYALGIALQRCMLSWRRAPWQVFALTATVALGLEAWNMWSRILPHSTLSYLLLNSVLLVSLYFAACRYCQLRPSLATSRMLRDLDRCGMGIYILHHIFIEAATHASPISHLLCEHYCLGPVAIFLTAFLLAWLVAHAMLKTRLRVLFG